MTMAAVLCSLLEKSISVETLINWLKTDGSKPIPEVLVSSDPSPCDFMSFFLNYLRDQTSVMLHECPISTPSKIATPAAPKSSEELVNHSRPRSSPTSAELFKTPDSVTQLGARIQHYNSSSSHQRSSFSGSGRKHGGSTSLWLSDSAPNDSKCQAQQDRSDFSGSTPRTRGHGSTVLGEFLSAASTTEGQGRTLFQDAKRSFRGRGRGGSVSRNERVRKPEMNMFCLENSADFPEISSSLSSSIKSDAALPSRRITPTLVSSPLPTVRQNARRIVPVTVLGNETSDVKNAFSGVPIVPAPAHAMPRSVWAQPREVNSGSQVLPAGNESKDMKTVGFELTGEHEEVAKSSITPKKVSLTHLVSNENVLNSKTTPQKASMSRLACSEVATNSRTTPQKTSLSRLISCEIVSADVSLATHVEELNVLADFYSSCLANSLVPNVVVEMYFIVQLLCVRSSPDQNSFNIDEEDTNYLSSVHNCVFFATQVLLRLQNFFLLLDRHSLYLLANNHRVIDFAPQLKQVFSQMANSSVQTIPVFTPLLLGGVTFQADTDNRTNFPSERLFQLFKKQRDLFYELVREWEDRHMDSGWTVKNSMTDRIRCLVHFSGSDLSNHLHLVRLFILQLMQMCRADKLLSDDNDDGLEQSELKNMNPERRKRLQERLIMPSSVGSVCPNPSFPGSQEFFRDFIVCASSSVFNHHLCEGIVAKIVELSNCHNLLAQDAECEDGSVSNETRSELIYCLVTLRILGKFVGFLTFLPYQSVESPVESVALLSLKARNETGPSFDVCRHLKMSIQQHRLAICLAWLVDYLSMIDSLSTRLNYYQNLLVILISIYRFCCPLLSQQKSHAVLLIVSLLGWFFELKIYPDVVFYKEQDLNSLDIASWQTHLEKLDPIGVIDQRVLYACCPHLGEIRNALLDFEIGGRNQRGAVRKITPILSTTTSPAVPKSTMMNEAHIQVSLEESFFRMHSSSLRRTVEFVAERLTSNWIKIFQAEKLAVLLESGHSWCHKLVMDASLSQNSTVLLSDNVAAQMEEFAINQSKKVVDTCQGEYSSYFESKSIEIISSLMPNDMSRQVIDIASSIARRMASKKVGSWLASNISPGFFVKQMKSELEKIVRVQTAQKNAGTLVDGAVAANAKPSLLATATASCHDMALPSPSDVIISLKNLVKLLLLRSCDVSIDLIQSSVNLIRDVLTSRQDLLPAGTTAISRLMSDIALITVAYRPDLWTSILQHQLIEMWQNNASLTAPVKKIVCHRSLGHLETSPNPEVSWSKFKSLLNALIACSVLSFDEVQSAVSSVTSNQELMRPESYSQLATFVTVQRSSSPGSDDDQERERTLKKNVTDSFNADLDTVTRHEQRKADSLESETMNCNLSSELASSIKRLSMTQLSTN